MADPAVEVELAKRFHAWLSVARPGWQKAFLAVHDGQTGTGMFSSSARPAPAS